MIDIQRVQALFPAFPNPHIIAGLVYEHTTRVNGSAKTQ